MKFRFQTRVQRWSKVKPDFDRYLDRVGYAAARASDQVFAQGQRQIRVDMGAARLGRLSRAVAHGSDWKNKRLPRLSRAGMRWRGGAYLFLRGQRNERTLGTFQAYSEGATIMPRKGRWLWIATDELAKRVGIPGRRGGFRMTPARYLARGLDKRIGELEFIEGKNAGEAMLIVRDVTVSAATGFGKARRLPKSGNVRAGRVKRDFVVAFVGIRQTRRTRRFNPKAALQRAVIGFPAAADRALRSSATRIQGG